MRQMSRTPRTLFRVAAVFKCFVLCGFLSGCASSGDPVGAIADRAEQSREQGHAGAAGRQYEQAARAALEAQDSNAQLGYLLDAADCWLADGKPSIAKVHVGTAERLIDRMPAASTRARVGCMRVACLRGDLAFHDDPTQARRNYDSALKLALGRERDGVYFRQSLLAEQRGDLAGAKRLKLSAGDPKSPLYAELRAMLGVRAAAATAARGVPPRAAPPEAATQPPAAAKAPPILPRTSWGARRTRSNFDRMTPITRVTVHHTATRLSSNSARVAADAIRSYQREHQEKEGWADIGYHFMVDPAGRIWEGRPLTYQGAHAGSPELNVGNIGIALIGDFTVQQPTSAQKKALVELLDSLCAKYRLAQSRVYTHQEIRDTGTACPGPALQRVVEQWRRGSLKT
ncbi:MAG: N-acetylmuramoyl-L-alanine amidase [Planctomycetes bacterium]|nr:N-acetylmuramoyl-L-alanine amidase [Planctomycetota bacterium]